MLHRIRATIEHVVTANAIGMRQRDDVLAVLRRPDYPLSSSASCRFGVLTSVVYEVAGGSDENVQSLAAATTELFLTASYVLDHVMDDEIPTDSSPARETVTGIALLMIAEGALLAACKAADVARPSQLANAARSLVLQACAGQAEEVALATSGIPDAFTTDDALALTERKAGSLGRLAGTIGTALARTSSPLAAAIQAWCRDFATYRQVLDDLADAIDDGEAAAPDAARYRPTIPLVYFLNWTKDQRLNPNELQGLPPIMQTHQAVTEEALRTSGAYLFTQLVAEMLRNRLAESASQLAKQSTAAQRLQAFLTATAIIPR